MEGGAAWRCECGGWSVECGELTRGRGGVPRGAGRGPWRRLPQGGGAWQRGRRQGDGGRGTGAAVIRGGPFESVECGVMEAGPVRSGVDRGAGPASPGELAGAGAGRSDRAAGQLPPAAGVILAALAGAGAGRSDRAAGQLPPAAGVILAALAGAGAGGPDWEAVQLPPGGGGDPGGGPDREAVQLPPVSSPGAGVASPRAAGGPGRVDRGRCRGPGVVLAAGAQIFLCRLI